MIKILIFFLLGWLVLPSFGQYSQSLDDLSRREIRELILSQDQSKSAKTLVTVHKSAKVISIVCYSLGALMLISTQPPKSGQINFGAYIAGATAGVGLIFTLISEVSYHTAVDAFKRSSNKLNASFKLQLRNDKEIYPMVKYPKTH